MDFTLSRQINLEYKALSIEKETTVHWTEEQGRSQFKMAEISRPWTEAVTWKQHRRYWPQESSASPWRTRLLCKRMRTNRRPSGRSWRRSTTDDSFVALFENKNSFSSIEPSVIFIFIGHASILYKLGALDGRAINGECMVKKIGLYRKSGSTGYPAGYLAIPVGIRTPVSGRFTIRFNALRSVHSFSKYYDCNILYRLPCLSRSLPFH